MRSKGARYHSFGSSAGPNIALEPTAYASGGGSPRAFGRKGRREMRTLYLQRMPSLVGRDAFSGRRLFDEFTAISEESLLSFAVVEDDNAKSIHPNVKRDFISKSQCLRFNPNVIYIEGGLFYLYGDDWRWRVTETLLKELVARGTVVIVADIDRNYLHQQKKPYRAAGDFLGAYAQYSVAHLGEKNSEEAVYGIDETSN
jgi:hypothetical protein